MSPEQELMQAEHRKKMLTPPTDEELQKTIDLVTGFGTGATVIDKGKLGKVWKLALEDIDPTKLLSKDPAKFNFAERMLTEANKYWQRVLGPQGKAAVSEADDVYKMYQRGPYNLAHRVEALKHAIGLPNNLAGDLASMREKMARVAPRSEQFFNLQREHTALMDAKHWAEELARMVE